MTLAIILIAVGILLLVAEVFIPSGGILFVLAIVALVLGVTMVFFAPESEGGGTRGGLITLTILFIAIPIVVGIAFHYWPRTAMGKRFMLPAPEEEPAASLPAEVTDAESLKGQIGQTVTELRPSGITLIQGRRVDTKTEGMFVAAGQWVRVIDVRPGHVLVRPLNDREIQQLPSDLNS